MPAPQLIDEHNAGIGTLPQRLLQGLLFLLVVGVPAAVLLRLLVRFEVRGREHRDRLEGPVIFAPQHYFELDPALTFYGGGVWPLALRRPNLMAVSIAGPWWFQTATRRAFAWLSGAIILGKGQDAEPALEYAASLLGRRRPVSVAIYPTGAIGHAREYTVMPGVARLAIRCPDVPVLPIAIEGVSQLRVADILMLRRPTITIAFCAPFSAHEAMRDTGYTATEGDTLDVILERIDAAWRVHDV